MEKHIFEYVQGERKFVVEIGELAKQANGACLVRFNDTAVLTAAVGSKKTLNTDFFPLTVLYQEKLYAAGKIPGSVLHPRCPVCRCFPGAGNPGRPVQAGSGAESGGPAGELRKPIVIAQTI